MTDTTTNHCANCEALAKEIEELKEVDAGKVLVEVEKLREVYVAFKAFLGGDPGIYPVVLDWLAATIEEAGNA